jgi:hypothetical protein
MRRFLLPPLLLSACLLLAGCIDGVAPIVPPIDEPEEVFNGEPTALRVVLQRNDIPNTRVLGLRSEPPDPSEPPQQFDTAYIRIELVGPTGAIIYRNLHRATIPADQQEITLPFELPAYEGWKIRGHTYRGDQLLGVAQPVIFDVPAKTVTTVALPLDTPHYEFYSLPDILYSGADIGQLRAWLVPQLEYVKIAVICGLTPWNTNPDIFNLPPGVYRTDMPAPYLPTVTEPQKLYYQVIIYTRAEYEDSDEYACVYSPDLSTGAELPYVDVLPYPGWTQE